MENKILRCVKEIEILLVDFENKFGGDSKFSNSLNSSSSSCENFSHSTLDSNVSSFSKSNRTDNHKHCCSEKFSSSSSCTQSPIIISNSNPSNITIIQSTPSPIYHAFSSSTYTSTTTSTTSDAKSNDKKSNESNDTAILIGASIIGIIGAFIGTHIMAKDEYVAYRNSDLKSYIKEIKNSCKKSQNKKEEPNPIYSELLSVLESYETWKLLLKKRTKSKSYAKASTLGFIVGTSLGVALQATPFIIFGIISATASGCYWYYHSLTSTKSISEQEALIELRSNIQKLKNTLENQPGMILFDSSPRPSASAPAPSME